MYRQQSCFDSTTSSTRGTTVYLLASVDTMYKYHLYVAQSQMNTPRPLDRRLKLRTVVSIAPEGPMEDEAMFCREHAAQLVPIRAELYREEAVTVSSQQVAQVNIEGGWLQRCNVSGVTSSE